MTDGAREPTVEHSKISLILFVNIINYFTMCIGHIKICLAYKIEYSFTSLEEQ